MKLRSGNTGMLLFAAVILVACGTPPDTAATSTVRRGTLQVTVSGSGSVEPMQSAELNFSMPGTVETVAIEEGAAVKQGQLLAALDARDVQQAVLQAEANLQTAHAKLEQAQNGNATEQDKEAAKAIVDESEARLDQVHSGGVTADDIAAAQAQVDRAAADLRQAMTGNVTAADIENAEAAVRNAEAFLRRVTTGNITAADIAYAEAAVRNAEANLERVRTANVTPADIANAEAAVRSAEANLERVQTANVTQADIDNAQAVLRAAQAGLDALLAGPSPSQVSTAQQALTQAQVNYSNTATTASANKTTAEQAVVQAGDQVRVAQELYSKAYWNNQMAQSGIDPLTGISYGNLEEIIGSIAIDQQKQKYATELETADLKVKQAESQLEQAKVAYETAKQQEIDQLAAAQSQVDDAQVQLDELLKGAPETDITQAQAKVDQARSELEKLQQGGTSADIRAAQAQLDQAHANLAKLKQGGTPADIRAAQAQLDQARANLAKLKQGGTPADIAGAQAQLDQARANLKKLKQGGTAAQIASAQAQLDQTRAELAKLTSGGSEADITAAQAQVSQAEANYEKLTEGATRSDLAIAEAGVRQADAQLAAARLNLDKATLRAPFDGIITLVNVGPGDSVGLTPGSAAPFMIVDPSQMHIDVSISEADVAQIHEGQTALVTVDALGIEPIAGTINYIAPAAVVVQNVTTYPARIDLPESLSTVRVGMNVSVEIGIAEKSDVLVIPSGAIRSDGGRHFVRREQGEEFVETEIQIGLVNDVETEVTGGLNEGDTIASIATAPGAAGTGQ